MNILAVITARGGSKAIPGKNIKLMAGKPLLAYTCEAARASGRLDRIILSTDSPEIAEVGRRWGAEVPFMRPAELSGDTVIGVLPVIHALEWMEANERYRPDYVFLLQPTSPLRTAEDINRTIDLAIEKQADSVVGVTEPEVHPYWAKGVDERGRMINLLPLELADRNRQDHPQAYAVNGAIYLTRRSVILEKKTLFPAETYVYVMPPERALDVNTPWEWHLLELVLRDRQRVS